ncbi:hypothetical protein V6N13_078074 [Hibiscus sabdariffa]
MNCCWGDWPTNESNIAETLTNCRRELQRKWIFNPIPESLSIRKQARDGEVFVRGYVDPAKWAIRTNFEPRIDAVSMETMATYRQRPELFPLGHLAEADHAVNAAAAAFDFPEPFVISTAVATDGDDDGHEKSHGNTDYREHICEIG